MLNDVKTNIVQYKKNKKVKQILHIIKSIKSNIDILINMILNLDKFLVDAK